MPESSVCPRKSIHDRKTPLREQCYEEDESILEECKNSTHPDYDSGSDVEQNQEVLHFRRTTNMEFKMRRSLPPNPQHPETSQSLMKIINATSFKSKRKSKSLSLVKLFLFLFALPILYFFLFATPGVRYCTFENLIEKYPKENSKLWTYLKIGVEAILNRQSESPAVFLFIHHGGEQPYQLIRDIASQASSCFGKKLVPMEREDFLSKPGSASDFGYVIEKYKNKIQEGNVILIANLNEISSEAAKALHFICDTYSPIDKNAVIVLALKVYENEKGTATAIAEKTLTEIWGSNLSRNELDPLITRVTDQVIFLKSGADIDEI